MECAAAGAGIQHVLVRVPRGGGEPANHASGVCARIRLVVDTPLSNDAFRRFLTPGEVLVSKCVMARKSKNTKIIAAPDSSFC